MEPAITHVLYISTVCKVCRGVRAQGVPHGVRVENVVDISPLPAWLDGTPTLVDVSVGVLYKGSDALIVLDHMRQNQAQAAAQAAQAAQAQARFEAQQQQPQRAPVIQGPQGPPRPQSPVYQQGPPQGIPQGHPRGQSPKTPFEPEPARREATPKPTAGESNQSDGPTNWDAMFSEAVDDGPPAANGRTQKFSESSISEMLSRRAQQTPPIAGLQVK